MNHKEEALKSATQIVIAAIEKSLVPRSGDITSLFSDVYLKALALLAESK